MNNQKDNKPDKNTNDPLARGDQELDDQELDHETATDELSQKINRLESQLKAVSSKEDKKLFLWLGLGLAAIFFHKFFPNQATKILMVILVPASILVGLGYAFYNNYSAKKKVLIRFGLKCKSCGHIPNTLNASGMFYTKKCLKCGAEMQI